MNSRTLHGVLQRLNKRLEGSEKYCAHQTGKMNLFVKVRNPGRLVQCIISANPDELPQLFSGFFVVNPGSRTSANYTGVVSPES